MQCSDFIEGYSEYRDGLLAEARTSEFRHHLSSCGACARYDRVIRSGLDLLGELPAPEPSDDFLPRLQHRLYNIDEGVVYASSHRFLGSAALVAVASVGLLALLWLPFATTVPVEIELPAVAVERPPEQLVEGDPQVSSLLSPGPFVQPASLDARTQSSFLDGERSWYPARQQGSKPFLTADIR